jgi:hypothetical protein
VIPSCSGLSHSQLGRYGGSEAHLPVTVSVRFSRAWVSQRKPAAHAPTMGPRRWKYAELNEPGNARSIAVAERSGFVREGLLRQAIESTHGSQWTRRRKIHKIFRTRHRVWCILRPQGDSAASVGRRLLAFARLRKKPDREQGWAHLR